MRRRRMGKGREWKIRVREGKGRGEREGKGVGKGVEGKRRWGWKKAGKGRKGEWKKWERKREERNEKERDKVRNPEKPPKIAIFLQHFKLWGLLYTHPPQSGPNLAHSVILHAKFNRDRHIRLLCNHTNMTDLGNFWGNCIHTPRPIRAKLAF